MQLGLDFFDYLAANPQALDATGAVFVAAGAPFRATVTVRVDDMSFKPHTVTINVGDSVTWSFDDTVARRRAVT